jgi:hypothetical protein
MTSTATDSARSNGSAPWIVAGALGAVAIALAAVVIFVIHPDRSDKHRLSQKTGLTSTQQQAVDAATQQAINLTTYARATFEADYKRTVDGATGNLAKDLNDATKKTKLLEQMNAGKFDLQGTVSKAAYETEADGKYSVLVYVQGFQLLADGKKSAPIANRFLLTMQRVKGKWLASDLLAVNLV